MKKYLMFMVLTIVFGAQAYDRRPYGSKQTNKRCCWNKQNICYRVTQNICNNLFYVKECVLRTLMHDSASYAELKKEIENEYASIDLAMALVLFKKHRGERFDEFMLSNFDEENTFALSEEELAHMQEALTAIKDRSSRLEGIYRQLGYLSLYEERALLTALRFRMPILHVTYRHRHLSEEKLTALESCLLKILEKIAEDD